MKKIKFIAIAGLCLSMALAVTTSCKKKKEEKQKTSITKIQNPFEKQGNESGESKKLAPITAEFQISQALVDSASYLAGVQNGAMLRNYNFCKNLNELNLKMFKEGMNAAFAAEGDFGTDEFNKSFKIKPEMMNTIFPAFLDARADSAYVANKAQVDSVSYLLGVNSALICKLNMGIAESIEDLNLDEYREGTEVLLGLSKELWEGGDEQALFKEFKISPMEMQHVFMDLSLARTKGQSEAFLNYMAKKPGVVKTESGLLYEIIEPGNDVKPAPEDEVSVYYEGRLIDGNKFDGNMEAEQPITFALNGVIKGWTEGLQYIGEGGNIRLYIPSELAYGDQGAGYQIKGGAALAFEVKLVSVKKAEPAAEETEEAIAEENAAVLAE